METACKENHGLIIVNVFIAVTPIIDIVPLAIPYDVNSTTHNNRSTQPELGDSVQWSVSAQAGVGDRLVWTLNGQELPAVEADSDHEKVTTNYQYIRPTQHYLLWSPYKQVTLCNRAIFKVSSFLATGHALLRV